MTNQTVATAAPVDAYDRLAAQLNEEQRKLLSQVEQEQGKRALDEFRRLVDAFAQHHPGLEVAIQGIADHIARDSVITRGCSCVPERSDIAESRPTSTADSRPALAALQAALSAEQWRLYLQADAENSTQWTNNEDRLIAEFARHLPGQAPAIRVIGAHILEQRVTDRGVCCEGQTA